MNSIDNKQVAENIKVLKTEEVVISSGLEVNSLITGIIKNITDFGIFVKLNEKEDGLLHKNALNNALKNTFKEKFSPGQKINVKIIKVTEKGLQLKLKE